MTERRVFMKRTKKWMAVAGAGLAVLMLTVVALPVAADTTVAAPLAHRGGPMGGGASDTYLAEALGITADELQAAQQTANEAAIDQALAEGFVRIYGLPLRTWAATAQRRGEVL
jgi:hypothetical protein